MLKKDKQAIYEWVAGLSDEKLKDAYFESMDKTLGSQAEEMYERGYDIVDIKEREKYERWLCRQSDMLEFICDERGIKLWEEYTYNKENK